MNAQFKEFKLSTKALFDKEAPWEGLSFSNSNNHIVTVKNTKNGKSTKFEFWCSIVNPEFQNERDVLSALYCFVSDGLAGMESFMDFCDEFGYLPNRESAKIHNDCKRAYRKFKRVSGYTDSEIYDFVNDLSDLDL